MTINLNLNLDVCVAQFAERAKANPKEKQIDNSALMAGMPMVYYCRHCGAHTETLNETHEKAPKMVCDPCEVLVVHGLIDKAKKQAAA